MAKSSGRSTTVAPLAHVVNSSSTLMSKLIEQNCRTRSSGCSP
jgi:hypothetical protein